MRQGFYQEISDILRTARAKAYRASNFLMVEAYWNVGRKIIEEEQFGKKRAVYGEFLIQGLSDQLRDELGSGFDVTNLKRMRQFYVLFPKGATAWHLLSWSHFKAVLRVKKEDARIWYLQEASQQNWSVHALERQIGSLYYERLLMSRGKRGVVEKEAKQKTAELAVEPEDFIKDPYVLEFLGIPDPHAFRESDLEQAIIGKLQSFLLELGKGFAFVARQQRISTETKDCFIDLVFYNYLLKYSVLNDSSQIFASQYRLVLPTEEELRREIERERDLVVREQMENYG